MSLFIGKRVYIGGRLYTIRALLPSAHGATVESVDGFQTDVDVDTFDDEPPSYRGLVDTANAAARTAK